MDLPTTNGRLLRPPSGPRSLATFNWVIANPPFSLENWGDDVWHSDPFGRNLAGMPPGKSGDYAWVQHMKPKSDQVTLTVDAAMAQLRESATRAIAADEKLKNY